MLHEPLSHHMHVLQSPDYSLISTNINLKLLICFPPPCLTEVTQPGADLIDEDEFKLKDDVIIWLRQLECDVC